MSVWMVIVLLCQSINFSSIGLNPKQSATWPKLSGLLNSTANSFHILNFGLLLFAHSPQNLNTPKTLHPTGQPQPRQPLTISSRPFSLTLASNGSTINASLSSGQTSHPMGLAMLSANLVTMKPRPRQWMRTNAALISALWQSHLRLSSTRLLLVLGSAVVMRFVSTLIFVKDLLVIGQSTSANICSLGSNLYGQLTAT